MNTHRFLLQNFSVPPSRVIVAATLALGITASAPVASAAPGASPSPSPSVSPSASPSTSSAQADTWEDQVFDRMQKMQREMDALFRDSFNSMKTAPGLDDFFNSSGARFNASADIREQKDKYVARFYLPDRSMSNVDVRVDNGKTLRVTAKEETSSATPKSTGTNSITTSGTNSQMTTSSYSMSQYEQLVTLPGPVDASRMKVDRKENTLIVTLPKAGDSMSSPSPSPTAK
jgi:HSP20 family molecular chaperone IbpA